MRNWIRIIAAFLLLASCRGEDDLVAPDLRGQQISGEITLASDTAIAVADGIETIELTLSAPGAKGKVSSVTFSISPIGQFDNGDTVFTTALNAGGEAKALVRASAQEGAAIVTASVGGYTAQTRVMFTRPPIILKAEPPIAVADGQATIHVTLDAGANAAMNVGSVRFSISPIGKFANGDTVYVASLDAAGRADALVSALNQEGRAVIRATAGIYAAQTLVTFTRPATPPVTDTLTLSVITDNVPADNYSYAQLRVSLVNADPILKMRTITFQTDKGQFANGAQTYTINAGLNGLADAYLRHSRAERATVTATIAGAYTRQSSVNFVRAWPQALSVELAAGTIARTRGATLGVTAQLERIFGTPTEGTRVSFRDSAAATGGSVGTFLNSTLSNASGQAAATYSLQDTVQGYVYIIGTVDTGGGTVRNMNRVWVQ